MKKALVVLLLAFGYAFAQNVQTPQSSAVNAGGAKKAARMDTLSLYQVNYIPMDSLKIADSLGTGGRSSLTNSPYLGDTITVTGVVLADPALIGLSTGNTSFYIQSTDSAEWGGMNIFGNTTTATSVGITSVDTGYVIELTGVLTKYSSSSITGNFELMPIASQTIGVLNVGERPAPVEVKLSDLVSGDVSSGGKVHFYPGTKYKNSYVILRNLTVKTRSQSSTSGQWTVVLQDSLGNTISLYDPSKYFTGRSWGVTPKFVPPPVGSKLDYIRGILAAYVSYGYEIIPLYPGDLKIGVYTPSITATGFSTRRSEAFPLPSQSVTVRMTAYSTNPDTSIKMDSAVVYYSVDNGTYTGMKMSPESNVGDTITYAADIPPQADGSFVKYFFNAWANSLGSMTPDTSGTAFFYYVRASGYTIRDIQYTPFHDGDSGATDLRVTFNGIVQADSTDFPAEIDPRNQATKTAYAYVQDAAKPYSGVLLYGSRTYSLHRGDSVSITGVVSEYSGMTEVTVDTAIVIQTGKSTYKPVVVKTGDVGGKPSGDFSAEPWESVLLTFDSITVTNNDPDPSYSITSPNGSFREYIVDDGSGGCRVDDDGSNTYSPDPHDTTLGFRIIPKGAFFQSLTGLLKYSNGNYKLEPRTNADFSAMTGIKRETTKGAATFALEQNYPNPFNPTTTIRYSVPKASMVTLKIYNILGQEVTTLVNQRQNSGTFTVSFDASRFASGVYLYRLSAGGFNQVKKMMVVK